MFAIIGILIVFGSVIGGYLMEKGHIAVLLQPAELLIIAGSLHRHIARRQPSAHCHEEDCGRRGRSLWRVAFW